MTDSELKFYRVAEVLREEGDCKCEQCLEWTIVYNDSSGEECEISQSAQGPHGLDDMTDLCDHMNMAYEAGRALLPTQPSADLPKYQLEVGITPDGRDVIVNHPEMDPNPSGRGGHIVFSPQQARDFAALMIRKAGECQ